MAKEKTKIYNCEVRPGGEIMHTFVKNGVTQAEIRVLRAIHGQDGVVNVHEEDEREIDAQEEAYELALKYSKTSNPRHGVALIERVLNVNMDGFNRWLAERNELTDMERKERRDRQNREAAAFTAAREAAEAKVRADLAKRTAESAASRVAA